MSSANWARGRPNVAIRPKGLILDEHPQRFKVPGGGPACRAATARALAVLLARVGEVLKVRLLQRTTPDGEAHYQRCPAILADIALCVM